MSLNFNVDPYYDDFDPSKNFHRILFKPGYSVQGRELTQAQTILQSQISKFADHIFKQNTPVKGGKVTINTKCYYLKLNKTYGTKDILASDFLNKYITDDTGTVLAKVIKTAEQTGTDVEAGDPPTLIVSYISGVRFTDGMHLFPTDGTALDATTIGTIGGSTSTGLASVASISDGVFYIVNGYSQSQTRNSDGTFSKYSIGNFVSVQPETIILDKYNSTPSYRIGLSINESIVDSYSDKSLLDPAVGSSNYQAPGADRYYIKLTLTSLPLTIGNDDQFIELTRIENGNIVKQVNETVYSVIDDYFAKRTYETNGDYIVNNFSLTPSANTFASNKYILSVGPGKAYVQGYRVENQTTLKLDSTRARTVDYANNNINVMDYGSYFYVSGVKGNNGTFIDTTVAEPVYLHTVSSNTDIARSNTTTFNSTLAATAYIRGIVYNNSSNVEDTSTYVYKAYVYDIENKVLSGTAAAATATTIQFTDTNGKFSAVSNAYYGVTITIDSGSGAGDTRRIVSYNGTTKTATVETPFTVTPSSSTFSLRFGIKDTELIVKSTLASPCVLGGWAQINTTSGKSGSISTGDAVLNNPGTPELLFPLGQPYVASVTDTSYTTIQQFRNQSFGAFSTGSRRYLQLDSSATGSFDFLRSGSTEDDTTVAQNFMVVVTDKGTNTTIENGDVIPFTTAGRSIAIDADKNAVYLTALDLDPFTATVFAKLSVTNANDTNFVLKTKTLIEANTAVASSSGPDGTVNHAAIDLTKGQIYISNSGVLTYGNKQSLYVSDVKRIVKIIDTGGSAPTLEMFTDASKDITENYLFNNGQTDNYYGHAYISLKPGAPTPRSLWILFDYYQHAGGDGYFSAQSYSSSFTDRPSYTSRNGVTYDLRDCLDFRPAVKNAQESFTFKHKTTPTTTNNSGLFLPVDLASFTSDYSYYLARKDLLVIGKDNKFKIIGGIPSNKAVFPSAPEGSMVLAKISLDPYTTYVPGELAGRSNLSIEPVIHKRWQMSDITDLQDRVNNLEYYTSLNMMEQNAASLQIPDELGLNRFKNGILVDDFSTFTVADTFNRDFSASLNNMNKSMGPAVVVKNYNLQNRDLLDTNGSKLSTTTLNALSYKPSLSGKSQLFSLPYTEETVIKQTLASRTISANPFGQVSSEGTLEITPPMDNWIDNSAEPAMLFTGVESYKATDTTNLLDGDPTLRVSNWQIIPGTEKVTTNKWETTIGGKDNVGQNFSQTITTNDKQNQFTYGNWSKLQNSSGNYITDVSILPYIREQQLSFNGTGLLFNTTLNAFFDGNLVTSNIRKPNIIELTSVSGTFNRGDIIGYVSSSVFYKRGEVLDVYKHSTGTRLYVIGDLDTTSYTTGTLVNAFFNTSGVYQNSTASGTLSSVTHYSGKTSTTGTSTSTVTLNTLAKSTDIYTGKKLYIVNKPGQSATITAYNTSTKVVTLGTSITFASGDVYSIGEIASNEIGSVSGVFYLPANKFHTGQRVLRLDDRTVISTNLDFKYNTGTETTWTEATFFATSLSTKSQEVNYSASIQTAKNTKTTVQNAQGVQTGYTLTTVDKIAPPVPSDPVAQTFIVDGLTYPNGVFLNSINVFFKSKPSTNIPVQVYILPTLNGYPSGTSLDYSNVYLNRDSVKVSDNPHYKDSTTYTTFTFPSPVYINPDVMYAIVVRSESSDYTLWLAAQNDFALISTSKAEVTDSNPTNASKIGTAPYIGSLFESQNAMTWSAEQGKALMFTINRCKFTTSTQPSLSFVVPAGLPETKTVDKSTATATANSIYHAFNVSATDFTPPGTAVEYRYTTTLNSSGSTDGAYTFTPGKFGTPSPVNITCDDNKGERVLDYASNTSFKVETVLSSTDDAVSPIIADDGLTVYTVRHRINNLGISNTNISLLNGGIGYLANANGTISSPDITVSAPDTAGGSRAFVSANVFMGNVVSVYVTTEGSGYTKTPTITFNATSNVSASAVITGETSSNGGNAYAKYITKPVTLATGNDSGDLRVFFTAYRPVNTDIHVYYKIVSREDTLKLEDVNWQLMTIVNGSSKYSVNKNDTYEYEAAPGTNNIADNYISYTNPVSAQSFNSFYQYAIKVVMTSNDPTFAPALSDIRTIALPSGTGL